MLFDFQMMELMAFLVFLKDYENETERLRAILDLEDGSPTQSYKRRLYESPSLAIKAEVSSLP